MTEPNSPLEIVEEWRRKSFNLSCQSSDALYPLITKAFEATSLFLKKETNAIQRALDSLEFERMNALKYDEEISLPLRELSYGLIQSLQFALQDSASKQIHTEVAEDNLSLFTEGTVDPSSRPIDTLIASQPKFPKEIKPAIFKSILLKEEKEKIAKVENEETENDLILVEGGEEENIHLMDNSTPNPIDNSIPASNVDISNTLKSSLPNEIIKEENVVDPLIIYMDRISDDVKSEVNDEDANLNDSSSNESPMDQLNNSSDDVNIEALNENSTTDEAMDDQPNIEISDDVNSEVNDESNLTENSSNDGLELMDHVNHSSDVVNVDSQNENSTADDTMEDQLENENILNPSEKKCRKRRTAKIVDYTESSGVEEEKDEEYEEMEKGGERSESEVYVKKRKLTKKEPKTPISNGPKREMECPQCKGFHSSNIRNFIYHLKNVHSKSPTQAGILFRCDCGHESASASHYRKSKCEILNFSIIHEKTREAKCILCEIRPSTICGYTQHLRLKHSSTLIKNGIYLKCENGCRITSHDSSASHKKKCEAIKFSVHKN